MAMQKFIGATLCFYVDKHNLELSMLMEQEGYTIGFCRILKIFINSDGYEELKIKEGYHSCS